MTDSKEASRGDPQENEYTIARNMMSSVIKSRKTVPAEVWKQASERSCDEIKFLL